MVMTTGLVRKIEVADVCEGWMQKIKKGIKN